MRPRKARFGRHLPTVPSNPFLSNMPVVMREVMGNGYALSPTTRPYLTKAGFITVRLVFRSERRDSFVVTWTLANPVSEELATLLRQTYRGVVIMVAPEHAPASQVAHG